MKPFTPEEALRIVQNSGICFPFLEGLCAIRDHECEKDSVLKLIRHRALNLCLPAFVYGVAVGIRKERERRRRAHADARTAAGRL